MNLGCRLPVLMGLLLVLETFPAAAQPTFERPTFSPGDSWQFAYTRESDGSSGRWRRTIERVLPDNRLEIRSGGNNSIIYFDHSMNFVGPDPAGDPRELARFPLRVGDSWSFSRRFSDPHVEDLGTAKVVAYEQITVPAGTFDCFRVEARLSSANPGGTTASHSVRWYCPAIKWFAKERFEDRYSAKYSLGSTLIQSSELIRFRPGRDADGAADQAEPRGGGKGRGGQRR